MKASKGNRKSTNSKQWPFRLMLIVLGSTAMLIGLLAIERGYWWIRSHDPVTGTSGIGTTLSFAFLGALFITLGLTPWPRAVTAKKKSKDDLYEIPNCTHSEAEERRKFE